MGRTFDANTANTITAPDIAAYDITGDFTYVAWIKVATIGTFRTIISKGLQAAGTGGYTFRLADTNVLQVLKSNTALLASSSGTITDTANWHHVAVARTGNTYTFYLDGAASGGGDNATGINATDRPLQIGRDISGGTPSFAFSGMLAEVAIWNLVAVPAAEIALLAAGECPMNVQWPTLQGYWPLRGSESPEPDFSRNYTPATIGGTVPAGPHPPAGCDNTEGQFLTKRVGRGATW